MYPILKEGVTMGTFHYEGSDTTHYYIENADGQEFEISQTLWDALFQADGTHPLSLPDEGQLLLPQLKQCGLVRTSRFVRDPNSTFNRFILFPIGSRQKNRRLFRTMNAFLPVVSLLLFVLGVSLMLIRQPYIGYDFNWWFYIGLALFSVVLHEIGHLVAGLAYDYEISDIGVLLLGVVPMGAYVAHEAREDATKAQKIQFSLAGIEVNLLLAGGFLLAAMLYTPLSLPLVSAANMNVLLAGINLLPTFGLDGENALSAALGVDNISGMAKKWLRSKKRRQKLFRSGLPGYACFCVFALSLLSGVVLCLLIAFDVLTVVLQFF